MYESVRTESSGEIVVVVGQFISFATLQNIYKSGVEPTETDRGQTEGRRGRIECHIRSWRSKGNQQDPGHKPGGIHPKTPCKPKKKQALAGLGCFPVTVQCRMRAGGTPRRWFLATHCDNIGSSQVVQFCSSFARKNSRASVA